ncbi:hypothetical protein FFF34_010255 [Inquilinus sp. KBS0705]|nr:hypothetical protein FFF34_010255 [Inquilinus sp. KBS0705]
MITVIGIFDDSKLAEEAGSYLLANQFTQERVDMHTHADNTNEPDRVGEFFSHLFEDEIKADHYATLARQGSVITVHALSAREAQEAVDVLNNYGAINVNANNEGAGLYSQVIERIVTDDKRLKGV